MQTVYSQRPRSPNKSQTIYLQLRQQILRGDLDGMLLDEVATAESLGVSRTPVREAFQRLDHDGLIELVPGRGATVKNLSVQDVREISQLRLFLEPEAAYLAAGQIDSADLDAVEAMLRVDLPQGGLDAFMVSEIHNADRHLHGLVLAACGNTRLRAIVEGLTAPIERLQIALYPRRLADATAEHLLIVQRLRSRDGDAAREAMRLHLDAVQRSFMDLIIEQGTLHVAGRALR